MVLETMGESTITFDFAPRPEVNLDSRRKSEVWRLNSGNWHFSESRSPSFRSLFCRCGVMAHDESRGKSEDCRVSGLGGPGIWYNAPASRAGVDFSD